MSLSHRRTTINNENNRSTPTQQQTLTLFNQKLFTYENKKKLIEQVPEDFQDDFKADLDKLAKDNVSDAEKYRAARNFAKFLCENADKLRQQLNSDPELLENMPETLEKQFAEYCAPKPVPRYQPPDFLPFLGKTIAIHAINNVIPAAGTVLDMAYNIISGIPSGGGEDYCGANFIYCIQAYLQDPRNNQVVSRFSRTLIPGGSKTNNDYIYMNCVSAEKVGNILGNLASPNGTETYTFTSPPYYQSTINVKATNIPASSYADAQQKFTNLFADCQNQATSTALTISGWVGVGVGGAFGVAACAVAAYCIYKHRKNLSCTSKCMP